MVRFYPCIVWTPLRDGPLGFCPGVFAFLCFPITSHFSIYSGNGLRLVTGALRFGVRCLVRHTGLARIRVVPLLQRTKDGSGQVRTNQAGTRRPFHGSATVRATFNERVTLITFQPYLSYVESVFARRALKEVRSRVVNDLLHLATDVRTARHVRNKTVPRYFASNLHRRAILHPRTQERRHLSNHVFPVLCPSHRQGTSPEARSVVSFVVFVNVGSFSNPTRVTISVFLRNYDLTDVNYGQLAWVLPWVAY